MEYRYLGNKALPISVLSFGIKLHDNIENMKEILTICLKNGINFFDTAEFYIIGTGEKIFGNVLKELHLQFVFEFC